VSGDALAALDNYQGSDPVMVVLNVPTLVTNVGSADATLYDFGKPSLWRVRTAAIHGRVTGTMGTCVLGLSIDVDFIAGDPWTNAQNDSGINATSPQSLSPLDHFAYTWSTEIGDSYVGTNFQWGKTAMLGWPLVYVPGGCRLVMEMTGAGGFDGELHIQDGFIQVEKIPQAATQAGPDTGSDTLYLLPSSG